MKTRINKFMVMLIIILVYQCIITSSFAQVPQKMSYQAVIRDASNQLVTNQSVGMRVSILQGSGTGTEVYKEIYNPNPQTNANGLVTIEIGGGIPVTGTFPSIDWSAGIYFIKTEIDLTGGTNYTITGTSQLLSVPYTLYAKTAGSCTVAYYVGELYGGGVVFYVDQTGNHGLICSMIDLSTSQAWSNVSSTLIGATAKSDWDGQGNTNAIIAQSGHTTSAAKLCSDYTNVNYGTGVYSDWYLPAIAQLNKLYNSMFEVNKALESDGNSATTTIVKVINYWSSTEYNTNGAWTFPFFGGYTGNLSKACTTYVRAVRAF